MTETALYSARAIKGTALMEETRVLLRAWRPGERPAEFRRRVLEEDLLGKATQSRAGDVVRFVFARRLLADGDEPARSIQRLLARRGGGPWFSQLSLLYAARADVVVRDAVVRFLPQVSARGRASLNTVDMERFLSDQEAAGHMASPWSDRVRRRVAQHVLHQLSDLDVLGPPRRGFRDLRPYSPGGLAVAWLACDLRRQGLTDRAIPAHPDWAIWQLHEPEVREALDRWSDLGLWMIQAAGEVVRFTWTWSSWDEVVTVLEESPLV